MARPTILDEDMLVRAEEFIDKRTDFLEELVPTFEGLALCLGISRETVYAWEDSGDKEDASPNLERFSDIAKRLRATQSEKLLQKSLQGKYNPLIAKLMLAKHGYVDKTEQDITSKGEQIGTIDPIAAAEFTNFLKSKK